MIQGIDEWERGRAVEGTTVVQGCGNAHRRLVDVWDAKVDLSHD